MIWDTRKSSCVNARGIPPAPHIRSLGGGGGVFHILIRGIPILAGGTPILVHRGNPMLVGYP